MLPLFLASTLVKGLASKPLDVWAELGVVLLTLLALAAIVVSQVHRRRQPRPSSRPR